MKCLKMQVQIEMFIADELDVFELPAQAWSIKCTHPFFLNVLSDTFCITKMYWKFYGQ